MNDKNSKILHMPDYQVSMKFKNRILYNGRNTSMISQTNPNPVESMLKSGNIVNIKNMKQIIK